MKPDVQALADRLQSLIAKRHSTRGFLVRKRGTHLFLAREETLQPNETTTIEDVVRLTWLGGPQFGLSAPNWKGRWERLPFSGTLEELLEVVEGPLGYLIAPLTQPQFAPVQAPGDQSRRVSAPHEENRASPSSERLLAKRHRTPPRAASAPSPGHRRRTR